MGRRAAWENWQVLTVEDVLWVKLLRRMYKDTRRSYNSIFYVLNEVNGCCRVAG